MPRVPLPHPRPQRSLVARVRENLGDNLRASLRNNLLANGDEHRHYVVCGSDPLAYRLVTELAQRYRVPVTVVLPPRRRGDGPDLAEVPGVRVIRTDRIDEPALRAARVPHAAALALVQQDDVGNIHAALLVRELNPEVRLVVRMFNVRLGEGIQRLFPQQSAPVVLSDAEMAAPEFVAVTLGDVEPNTVQLPGRRLFVTRRTGVPPEDIVCGLADTRIHNRPVLLPPDQGTADMVLAAGDSGQPDPVRSLFRARASQARRRPLSILVRGLRGIVSRKLQIAILVLAGLVAVAGTGLAVLRHGGLWDAFYTTLITTVAGSAEQSADPRVQALQLLLVLAGLALLPVITAAVLEGLVNARLAVVRGRLQAPMSEHVIVIGLGNVGTRVIRELYDLGIEVVAIDKNENARGALLASELNIPLIIGDASQSETLRAACVQHCRALVVLSTDDVSNLEAALHALAVNPDLRVVLRLFDGDFAQRVQHAFNITFSRSVSYVAAPAFAAAMLDQAVLQTIPVGRRVLLIAEVVVRAGAALDGARLGAANVPNESTAIALTRPGGPARWTPDRQERLAEGDRITVVATRGGLNKLLTRAAPAPPPMPAEHGVVGQD